MLVIRRRAGESFVDDEPECSQCGLPFTPRIERQAENYGGDSKKTVNRKTGKVYTSKHRFLDAQIAPDE